MQGRKPQPAAIKQAKGNPGHRPVPETPELPAETTAALAGAFPFKIKASAKAVADLVGPQLRAINMLRATDSAAFMRYCDTMASYWEVTAKLTRLGGATYRCKMTNGGYMQRIRPEFIIQERLARRLDTLEDRFGLTPMSRQHLLLALMRNTQTQFPLPLPADAKPATQDDDMLTPPPVAAAAARQVPPLVGTTKH